MIARVAATAAGLVAVLATLLVLAEAVPDGAVVRQLDQALDRGQFGQELVPDAFGGLHDGFTECVVLGFGLGAPPEPMGLVARAAWAPRIGSCEDGVEQVRALAAGEEVAAGPYYRYWNGYAPLTRPTLALVGVTGLRVVAGIVLAAAGLFAAIAVGRRLGTMATVALAGPLLLASNVLATPAGSLTHALSLAAAFVGTGLVAVGADRGGAAGAAVAAASGAALFVYVDLLTTPALPWAWAAFVAAAVPAVRGASPGRVARSGLAAGLAWPAAWALTWATRWLLAAAVHGTEVLTSIGQVSRFRVSGEAAGVQDAVGAALRANLGWWWDRHATARVVLALAVVAVLTSLVVAARRDRGGARVGLAVLLAAPALVVPVWYELLSNHSQLHAFFTYRGVPAAVGVAVAACVVAARGRRRTVFRSAVVR